MAIDRAEELVVSSDVVHGRGVALDVVLESFAAAERVQGTGASPEA